MDIGVLFGRKRQQGDTLLADKLPIVVTHVAGNMFVSGLYWQKLDKVNGFMAEARKRAKQPDMAGMAIVTIRESDISVQAGFAPQKSGATKGAYSMASAIAGRLGHNFVAAIPLNDHRCVFVACHKGAILQGADLVLSLEGAEHQLQKYLQRIRLASRASQEDDEEKNKIRIYAPKTFGLDGSEERNLEELLSPTTLRRDYKLKQLAFGGLSPKEVRTLAAICVVLAALAYGGLLAYGAWEQKQRANANAKAMAEAIAEAKRRAGIQQGAGLIKIPTLPHPWLQTPPIPIFLRMCSMQFQQVAMVLGGWDLKKLECGLGHIAAWYVRDDNDPFATLNRFREEVKRRYDIEPDPEIQGNGNMVSFHAGFKPPSFNVKDGNAPAETVAVWDLISYFQERVGSVAINKQPQPSAQALSSISDQRSPPTPIQDWTTYSWEINNADRSAEFILRDLSQDTARLTAISFERNPSGDQVAFSFKGELYVH